MNRQQLTCQILGHRYEPEGERHGYYDCERCEATGYEPQPTIGSRIRGWIDWKLCQIEQWRAWRFAWMWRTRVHCDDCGRWFGRHSDSCLPF